MPVGDGLRAEVGVESSESVVESLLGETTEGKNSKQRRVAGEVDDV